MQRYTVTLISDTGGTRPTILVPFQPSALVTAFKDEVIKRASRQDLPVTAETHDLTLRLNSQTGAVVDPEDVLSDVILDSETVFAIFSHRKTGPDEGSILPTRTVAAVAEIIEGDAIHIRAITPSTARQDRTTLQTFPISVDATIQHLHEQVARHLQLPSNFQPAKFSSECNCLFARKISVHHASSSTTFVIHDKSVVEQIAIASSTKPALASALQARFRADIESQKSLCYLGGERQPDGRYTRLPVIAVCSPRRHFTGASSPGLQDESITACSRVLDLHTSEMPINSAAMPKTIKECGLVDVCNDGILDIFAVHRSTTSLSDQTSIGRDALFRSKAYWTPPVKQSDRGTAMFLACLRLIASLMQDMYGNQDFAAQDAVLHIFDLMSSFPPALRTLYLLAQGKTSSPSECAALSHTVFYILKRFMPVDIIGTDGTRLFEGSRLLFGLVLSKAGSVKLDSSQLADSNVWPYLGAFKALYLRDSATNEAVWDPTQTQIGLVEKSYYSSFSENGVLNASPMQQNLAEDHIDTATTRIAVLNGGLQLEATTFSCALLASNYTYGDGGSIAAVIDDSELNELDYLAELCGRNRLAVHKPRQLTSAISPCLTFDRNAHVAVYLGEQACGEAGRSSLVFRPLFGTETVDTAVMEQLIAPIIRTFEAEGTGVFDTSAGAAIRKLEAPDEVLLFCVDCSASMRHKTDLEEVNGEYDDATSLRPPIEGEYYARARYEDVKEQLCKHEGFDDMVAMVASARTDLQRTAVESVFTMLKEILATRLSKVIEALGRLRQRSGGWMARTQINDLESSVQSQKTFYAGVHTHEKALQDFLIYRALRIGNISTRWKWSPADPTLASTAGPYSIPALSGDLTTIPDDLRCPVSQEVLLDAVKAADGHIYSRHALEQWFAIRLSSPLHGTDLDDNSMVDQDDVAQHAQKWVDGDGLIDVVEQEEPPHKRRRSTPAPETTIQFQSDLGTFQRTVSSTLPINDLYKLAFRGLKARQNVFQLVLRGDRVIQPSAAPIASLALGNEVSVTIRVANEIDMGTTATAAPNEMALVKIYHSDGRMAVAYWIQRNTLNTIESITWKYLRSCFDQRGPRVIQCLQPWMDMVDSGDGMCTGRPCEDLTHRLIMYLYRTHCTGHLGHEGVYADPQREFCQTLVLKVMMHTLHKKLKRGILTRLDVLKQMFEALINRILAYGYKTHVGLITFATEAAVVMPISHVIENFRKATNNMSAKGNTALFDALALARDQQMEYGLKYPDAKKRVICISDGEDTGSVTNTAQGVAWRMFQDQIAVDSICLGYEENTELYAVSHALGCYKFGPESLAAALSMCELESFLSLTDRPPVTSPMDLPGSQYLFNRYFQSVSLDADPTAFDEHNVPERKGHPNMNDCFIPLDAAARRPGGHVSANSGGAARSNLRTTRLLAEMRQIVAGDSRDHYDVYVSESDMSFWKVVLEGPSGTSYENGTFMLYIHAEERYPATAPKARFVTKIRHPNVNAHGRICHSILDRDWTSDTSMTRLIDTIYGLLLHAEASDPVNTISTLDYHHDRDEYNLEVEEWVGLYANKTREEWRRSFSWDGPEEGANEDEAF